MRVVPAKNGWQWLAKGFALFRKSPAMWLLLVSGYWLTVGLLGQIRYVGAVVSTVLLPVFSMSFMIVCAALDTGGRLRPALLFAGFRLQLATLLMLGGLYMVSILLVLAVTALADGGAVMQWILTGQIPPQTAIDDGSVSAGLIVGAVAGLPVLMAFWFAPPLAGWARMGAGQSLFYSFFASWRNWRALAVYGAVLALAGMAYMVLVAVVAIVSHGKADALRSMVLLFTLLTLPIIFGSFYASYRDVFPESKPAEPRPPEHPGA